jgi:hypothetical protein
MHPAHATVVRMSPWRYLVALGLVAFILGGHILDITWAREHWPFSYYPMYARVESARKQTLLSLSGLMRSPGKRAIVRLTDSRYVPPLNEGRLRVILMAAYRRGDRPQNIDAVKQVMRDYMRLYEARRIAGLHDGPQMQEIYLYRFTWNLRPDGTPQSKPSKSEQLLKVTWAEVVEATRNSAKPRLVGLQ